MSPPTRISFGRRLAASLLTTHLLLRGAALAASSLALFIVTSALAGGIWAGSGQRLACGLAAVALPWMLRWRLRDLIHRRLGFRPRLGGVWFGTVANAALLCLLCLGLCVLTGQALRRRGDWFLLEADGWLPRRYRAGLSSLGCWLERFDLPPETMPLMAEAASPPAAPANANPHTALPRWFHPLRGPGRILPPSASCRFGAPRPGPRPPECELGHCGVDLFRPSGTPVYAVHDGVVSHIQRDAASGGISGRFVILAHQGGAIETIYVHLATIPPTLHVGAKVAGGHSQIGTVGATGCKQAKAHLHFGLTVRKQGRRRHIDPEPLLLLWPLPAVSPQAGSLVAIAPAKR